VSDLVPAVKWKGCDLVRVNVYQEEITGDVEYVVKENVIGEDGKPATFYGVRVFLEGSEFMHYNEFDDDRPAITFWSRKWTDLRDVGSSIMTTAMSGLSAR
jgi:hypothetical protein